MKVYVLTGDDYHGIGGVYASPEAAMAAHAASYPDRPRGEWKFKGDGRWSNGIIMYYGASIQEWVVDAPTIFPTREWVQHIDGNPLNHNPSNLRVVRTVN